MYDIDTTFVLIKPDAVLRGLIGKIISRFEERGLVIMGMNFIPLPENDLREHYAEHGGKLFFQELISTMAGNPGVIMAIQGENAVARVRALVGATNAIDAAPGTVRGDFGAQSGPMNLIHASDSVESAKRELGIWFGIE